MHPTNYLVACKFDSVKLSLDSQTSIHEPHYDVLSAAVAGAAATMLTLLTTLGSTNTSISNNFFLKVLFEAELLVLETALMVGIVGLVRRSEGQKRKLSHLAAFILILGTLLLWISATVLVGF